VATKNQTVEKICLLFVANQQAVATKNQAVEKICLLPIT
jgi:hypothetical protein